MVRGVEEIRKELREFRKLHRVEDKKWDENLDDKVQQRKVLKMEKKIREMLDELVLAIDEEKK